MTGLNCFEPDRASGDHCRWLESCLIHLHEFLWKIRFSNERPSLRPRGPGLTANESGNSESITRSNYADSMSKKGREKYLHCGTCEEL
jgi:hypothetical protein